MEVKPHYNSYIIAFVLSHVTVRVNKKDNGLRKN